MYCVRISQTCLCSAAPVTLPLREAAITTPAAEAGHSELRTGRPGQGVGLGLQPRALSRTGGLNALPQAWAAEEQSR